MSGLPITDLFNTGVDNNGNPLGEFEIAPDYFIQSPPGTFDPEAKVVAEGRFPFPNWVANSANSKWIGPVNNLGEVFGPGGKYTYRTGFTLPASIDLSALVIEGFWATDNPGTDIQINEFSTGNTNPSGFDALHTFTISADSFQINPFQPGWNVLDSVLLNNGDGATGLRVDGLSVSIIPEPASMLLFGFGMICIAKCGRKIGKR